MRLRKWLLACPAGAVVVATVIGCPPLLEFLRTACDGSDARNSVGHLHSEHERSRNLDARLAEVRRCRLIKEDITAAVLARRLTLLEAAAAFREVDEQLPSHNWEVFRRSLPGNSDEERYCWEVIRHAEAFLTVRPAEADRARAWLEAELHTYLEPGGPLHMAPQGPDGWPPD